jgi:hypothetical protein
MAKRVAASLTVGAGLVGVATLLGASTGHAVTFFTDFGPGDTYEIGTGWTIDSPFSAAMQFTPSQSGTVTQIDVGLTWGSVGTNGATVSLWTNSSGGLGTELGFWSVSGQPVFGLTDDTVTTVSVPNINISAGVPYFVYITPADQSTFDAWNFNNLPTTGNVVLFNSLGAENLSGQQLGAFDVQGNLSATPLPAALPLFATGLGAMGLLGWRRKRKKAAAVAAA